MLESCNYFKKEISAQISDTPILVWRICVVHKNGPSKKKLTTFVQKFLDFMVFTYNQTTLCLTYFLFLNSFYELVEIASLHDWETTSNCNIKYVERTLKRSVVLRSVLIPQMRECFCVSVIKLGYFFFESLVLAMTSLTGCLANLQILDVQTFCIPFHLYKVLYFSSVTMMETSRTNGYF